MARFKLFPHPALSSPTCRPAMAVAPRVTVTGMRRRARQCGADGGGDSGAEGGGAGGAAAGDAAGGAGGGGRGGVVGVTVRVPSDMARMRSAAAAATTTTTTQTRRRTRACRRRWRCGARCAAAWLEGACVWSWRGDDSDGWKGGRLASESGGGQGTHVPVCPVGSLGCCHAGTTAGQASTWGPYTPCSRPDTLGWCGGQTSHKRQ